MMTSIFDKTKAILNKPFPEDSSRFGEPKTILVISLFVTFFLYVFQPFGISTLASNKFWICLGFGVMTFSATVIYEFIIGQMLNLKGERENWTFGKWIINNLGIMLAISLANFLFIRLAVFGYIRWDLFHHMVYGTFMIGIIPLIVLGWYSLNRQEQKFIGIAAEINQKENPSPSPTLLNEATLFEIPIGQIKFVEALQNYVKIAHLNSDGVLVKQTQRITLKQVLSELPDQSIIQCHRSFLVNKEAIISTSGNAQGLLLTLSDCNETIPVSRSYVPVFRNI